MIISILALIFGGLRNIPIMILLKKWCLAETDLSESKIRITFCNRLVKFDNTL